MTPEAERYVFAFGDFLVDPAQRVLLAASTRQPLPLSPRVFDTLAFLVAHPGQLLEKSALMKAVWPGVVVEENSLSQSISVLRRVLGENPGEHRYIATIPGRGYQFVADVRVLTRANGLPAGARRDGSVEAARSAGGSAEPISATDAEGGDGGGVGNGDRDRDGHGDRDRDAVGYGEADRDADAGLMRVSSEGGAPRALSGFDFDSGDTNQWAPHFLPDGKTLLYVHNRLGDLADRRQIAVERVDTGERRVLFNGTNPHYLASGHIVYMRQESDALWAVPFDAERLEVTGEALPVLTGVRIHTANAAHFSVSRDGTLAYVPGTMQSRQGRLIWKGPDGETQPFVDRPEGFPRSPRLSPDGTLLAADFAPPGEPADPNIWIYDVERERAPLRLTLWGGSSRLPTWAPDGQRIAFQWTRASHGIENGLFLLDIDGVGQPPEFLGVTGLPLAFSHDGRDLVYAKDNGLQRDLWVVSLEDGATHPLLATPFNEDEAAVSPDGKHIAFVSDQTGRPEVYVQPYAARSAPLRVSRGGGHEPVWSRDGARLYYQSGSRLLAAAVSSTESGLRLGPPEVLFEGGFLPYTPTITLSERTYDVAADGRFVMVDLSEAQADEIIVVQQWAQEVADLMR